MENIEPTENASPSEISTAPKPHVKINRGPLIAIAKATLRKIQEGSYELDGATYNIKDAVQATNNRTLYYPADSDLSEWSRNVPTSEDAKAARIEITLLECSTLAGARNLKSTLNATESLKDKRVGVLNFASAKSPGGGFLDGSRAQEESIARSSTMYPSLTTEIAEPFYQSHKRDPKKGLFSHAMIYSPGVLLLRSDEGDWLSPVEVDILTSPAVNAGTFRGHLRKINSDDESEVDMAMKERMARILYLFERQGVRNLVLGSFGTGAFKNRIDLVAGIWRELLASEDARFKSSFDRVVFAILGTETYQVFQAIFA